MRLIAILVTYVMSAGVIIAGPLTDAAKSGDTVQIAQILDGGADVNEAGFATPLQMAAMFGHAAAVKLLVDRGADVDAMSSAIGTAAHAATKGGHTEALRIILEAKANPNARDGNGYTPLMIAAQFGHTDAIKALLEHNADFNLIAEVNRSVLGGLGKVNALHVAMHNGNFSAAEELIQAGASPKEPTSVTDLIETADSASGRESALKWCGNCHVVESKEREGLPTGNGAGPTLAGVFGRASASVPDYERYTDALKQLEWVWNEDNLFAFSNEPMLTVPGTRMRYRDGWTEEELADIVAYFKSVAN